MNLVIVTGIWGRAEVFKMFARGVKKLESIRGLNVKTIVAGSEGDVSKNLTESFGFEYIEIPNQPLSKKMQSTVDLAKKYNPDYVLCMGSDDVLSVDLMKEYLKHMKNRVDYIGCIDFYFYDLQSKQSIYWAGYREEWRKGHLCGAGRCLSRNLLDKLDWVLWNSHDTGLDTSMQQRLNSINYTKQAIKLRSLGLYAVDFKSSINMTPFKLWDNSCYIDSDELESRFSYVWNSNNNIR